MARATFCLLCLFCLAAPILPAAPADGWMLAFRDDFRAPRKGADSPIAGPGSPWVPLRGDWFITAEGRLRTQRIMRRHLLLPSGVTLRGRGAGKTTLVHCDTAQGEIVSAKSGNGRHLVALKDASAFRPGDAVCYGGRWAHPGTVGVYGARNRDTIRSEGTGSKIERNLEETILPSGSSVEEWRQGR